MHFDQLDKKAMHKMPEGPPSTPVVRDFQSVTAGVPASRDRRMQQLAARPELLQRLSAAAEYPIVRILAPAGFGKTTAVRQLLSVSTKPIYIALPKSSSTFADFGRVFANGCSTQLPSMVKRPQEFLSETEAFRSVDLLVSWANVNLATKDCTVAIDDIHNANENALISEFITRLIDLRKSDTQFIISSRSMASLPHARWEAYGDSDAAITADDLRMSLNEASSLAVKIGSSAPIKQIEHWVTQTHGWPVPLTYAIRMSVRKGDDLEIMQGTRSLTFQFLADHLWKTLREDCQRLLELASLLPALKVQFFENHGFSNVSLMLKDLCYEVSFLTLSDDNVFSMHDLFRDFVMHQINQRESKHYESLVILAVAILFEANRSIDAFQLLLELGNSKVLTEAIDTHEIPNDIHLRGRLVKTIDNTPIEKRSCPALALSTDYWLRSNNAKGLPCAEAIISRVEAKSKHLLSAIRTIVHFKHFLPNSENVEWAGRIALIICRLDSADRIQAEAYYALCLARFENLQAKAKSLIDIVNFSIGLLDEITRIDVENTIAIAYFLLGESTAAASLSREAASLAERIDYQRGQAQALNALGLMLFDLEDPSLINVSIQLRSIVERSANWNFSLTSHWLPAEYYLKMGDSAEFRGTLALRESAITTDESQRRFQLYFIMKCTWMSDLLEERYSAIVSAINYNCVDLPIGADYCLATILSLAQVMSGDPIASQHSLERARKKREAHTTAWERRIIRWAFQIELAAACANGLWTRAKNMLRNNRELIDSEHKLYFAFGLLTDGPPFNGITEATEAFLMKPYLGLSALIIRRIATKYSSTSEVVILTPSENEVLQLLDLGKSNKEIASIRSRSVETVKRQLAAIYLKLGVENRTSAVAAARERGLLKARYDT